MTVNDDHPYFDEINQFAQMVVANMGSLMLAAANRTIRDLVNVVNKMVESSSTNIKGCVNDHSMTPIIGLSSASSTEVLELHEANKIHLFITGQETSVLTSIHYELVSDDAVSADGTAPGRTTWTSSDPTDRFKTLTAYLVGGAFEQNKSLFISKHGRDSRNWDPMLQFFRHLRNGCFHSNKFNITPIPSSPRKGQPQIDPQNPPRWSNYVMSSDANMNGQKVIGGFMHIHQVIPFLDDVVQFV